MHPRDLAKGIAWRLDELQGVLRDSKLFFQHEFVGSTLLFLADVTGRTSVSMIDFGVTKAVEGGLRHDVAWELGNREDGYLTGLDNLRRLWAQLGAWDDARWAAQPTEALADHQPERDASFTKGSAVGEAPSATATATASAPTAQAPAAGLGLMEA